MMRWIVGSSLKFRRFLVAIAAGLLFFGVVQLRRAPVDALPEFKPPQVELQTEVLGLSAEEVEQLVTVPLEQDLLAGVAFLDHMESASLPGLSDIVMTFEPGTSLLDARQVVSERLTQVAGLPSVGKPPEMIQPTSSTSRAAIVQLSSRTLTPIQLSVLGRWVITPRLLGVPGVAHVDLWGQRDRQLQVLVDPKQLRAKGVTLDQIVRTTGNSLDVSPLSFIEAANPGTGGFLDMLNQRLQVFHEQAITNAKELGEVSVESPEGEAVRSSGKRIPLKDVSSVVEDHQPLIGDALCSGAPCLMLVIQKFPGANSVEVARGVDEALDAMRPGLRGVQIDSSIYRPATYVENSFRRLAWALLIGAILLFLLLGILFFNWRTALITAVVVLVSMAAAGLVLYLRGTSFNTMVVAGLVMALVAVVDDAVIDVENIHTRLRRFRGAQGDGAPAWRVVLDASIEMRRPIIFATIITFVAAIPLFFTKDVAGAFLPPLATSFLLAVGVSMLVALTLTPALGLLLLPGEPAEVRESAVSSWFERTHRRAASRVIGRPAPAFLAVGALLVLALLALPFLHESLSPSLRETDVVVRLTAPAGTSLQAMSRTTGQTADQLRRVDGVRNVGAHVGRAFTSDETVDVNHGEVWVNIDASADYDATVSQIDTVAERSKQSVPGIAVDVGTYSEEQTNTFLPGADDDLVVRVYGEDQQVLRTKAEDVRRALARVEGVDRADVHAPTQQPTIEVKVDLSKALRYGVKPGDVRRTAAILLSGITVGNMFQDQKVFDVVVWGRPEIRQSVADVENLLIDTPQGGLVPMSKIADVRVANAPAVIRHDGTSSYIDVTADAGGRDLASVAKDADLAIKRVAFPLEYHAEVLGGFADRESARNRLLIISLAVAIGVFLLLQAALGAWRLAALALGAIVLAVGGGLLAALAAGGTISLGSLAGLIGVVAIATRQVVVLMRRYQDLERRDGNPFGADLVGIGTGDRLRPIVTATLATVAILLPLIFFGNGAGFEIIRPMAVVMLGGTLTAALVNLLVTPAAYLQYGFVEHPDTFTDDLFTDIPDVELEAGREPEEARR